MRFAAGFIGITTSALVGVILGRPLLIPAAEAPPTPPGAARPTPAATAPATQDYYPLASRSIKLPIKYEKDRKAIRQVKLYVARNGENTWYQEAAVPPDRDAFTYIAKEDGLYWFTMVEEDMQGRTIPADLTRTAPDLKVVVDTVQPRVQFTNAKRNGEEVVVEWFIDDKHPDENNTKVHFRAAGSDGYWQEVMLPAGAKGGVRFAAGTTNPIVIRVTACDIAGNKSEATHEVPGTGTNTTTSMSPSVTVPPVTPIMHSGGTTPIPPPDSLAPIAPPVKPAAPPATGGLGGPVAPAGPGAASGTTSPTQPLATVDPRHPVVTATPGVTGNAGGPSPVAVWAGAPPTGAPTVEVSRAQVINYLAFDLGYEVESRGPSGISRVDLWVTRDDGRTWLKWSQHDGKGSSVRVNLGVPANPQPEGTYGFRVVPVSGAGLSEREPVAGDAAELRVVVDVTAPQLDLFPPVGDPATSDTLVIQWKASDKNFGEEPITIEWSDKPTGSWQPVAVGGDGVQQSSSHARRLPNTGSYSWRVPAGLAPRVYLKVTARDAAGNVKEIVTRDPILVDLVKPRAKISGIVGPVGGVKP